MNQAQINELRSMDLNEVVTVEARLGGFTPSEYCRIIRVVGGWLYEFIPEDGGQPVVKFVSERPI